VRHSASCTSKTESGNMLAGRGFAYASVTARVVRSSSAVDTTCQVAVSTSETASTQHRSAPRQLHPATVASCASGSTSTSAPPEPELATDSAADSAATPGRPRHAPTPPNCASVDTRKRSAKQQWLERTPRLQSAGAAAPTTTAKRLGLECATRSRETPRAHE